MKWNNETQRFFYRVAGVALHKGRVLLHKDLKADMWVLPGGSCEFGEDSVQALEREFREELNVEIKVGRLLWMVENFFELGGKDCHEIGLYYAIEFEGNAAAIQEQIRFLGNEPFPRLDGYVPSSEVVFEWVPLSELENRVVLPRFLPTRLLNLPGHPERIVNRDQMDEGSFI